MDRSAIVGFIEPYRIRSFEKFCARDVSFGSVDSRWNLLHKTFANYSLQIYKPSNSELSSG